MTKETVKCRIEFGNILNDAFFLPVIVARHFQLNLVNSCEPKYIYFIFVKKCKIHCSFFLDEYKYNTRENQKGGHSSVKERDLLDSSKSGNVTTERTESYKHTTALTKCRSNIFWRVWLWHNVPVWILHDDNFDGCTSVMLYSCNVYLVLQNAKSWWRHFARLLHSYSLIILKLNWLPKARSADKCRRAIV